MIKRISLIASFCLFMSLASSQPQSIRIGGKEHIEKAYVAFNVQVIIPPDSTGRCGLEAIQKEYKPLRDYLATLDVKYIQQSFPKYKWGDTIKTNSRGERIVIPNMAHNFRIYFTKPVPKMDVLNKLRSFPQVLKATGPAWAQHDAE